MTRLNVNILLFDAFSNMVLACLLEPLRVVRDQSGHDIHWTIMTDGDRTLKSSSGISVTPDGPQAAAPTGDLVVIIGGDVFRDSGRTGDLRRALHPMIQNDTTIIAADTGAWMLAKSGYLDGRRATLHWQLLDEFAETFPKVDVVPERFARDGNFWTCGTAAAALDLMLDYIRARFGAADAFDAGAMFAHDNARRYGASYPDQALSFAASPKLKSVILRMSERLENPCQMPELAKAAHISQRSLHRLFQAELHLTPGRYYLLLRLARARELLRYGNLSLTEIAIRCGFCGATTLTRSFRAQYGMSPRTLLQDR